MNRIGEAIILAVGMTLLGWTIKSGIDNFSNKDRKVGVAIEGSNSQYEYVSFQQMKPEMMEEAIKNAQKTAEQFAKASESELGKIQTAGQGQFEIGDRDQNTPYIKKLRVVTTVTYSLKE